MLSEFTTWLVGLVQKVFLALVGWVHDAAVWVFKGILSAVGAVIKAIPVPDFMANGLSALFSALDPATLYLMNKLGIPVALSFVAAGVTFRLLRKAVTLFQW